jgi:arabinan endo-1,5-alpha-L-arabinosidase
MCPPAGPPETYRNPVIDTDFPDPTILAAPVDGFWWAYSTQHTTVERWAHVPVARSRDLVHWEVVGDALPHKPEWGTSQWECAWAPHVVAADGRYLMYYAAMRDSREGMCIGVAVAERPEGPFLDTDAPLVCGDGFVAIDAMRFDDPASGRSYLYWGGDYRPICVRELAPDGLRMAEGSQAVEVLAPNPAAPYERLVEGPYVLLRGPWYVLFYSGDDFGGDPPHYAVMAARSRSPLGPFERLGTVRGTGASVILEENAAFLAPGHNSILTDAAGTDWIVYHAIDPRKRWNPGVRFVRRPMLYDRLEWVDGWPRVAGGTPSTDSAPGPDAGPVPF